MLFGKFVETDVSKNFQSKPLQQSSSIITLPGPVIILAYAFFFALSMVFLKILYQENYSVGQANSFSTFFQSVFSFGLYYFAHGTEIFLGFENIISIIILVFFIAATIFRQVAIKFADAGNCSSFLALVPLTTAPLAVVLINDKVNLKIYSMTCISCLIGVLLVIQPPFLFPDAVPESGPARAPGQSDIPGYILMSVSILAYSSFLVYQRVQRVDEYFITFWSSVSFFLAYSSIWAVDGGFSSVDLYFMGLVIAHAAFRVFSGLTLALGSSKTSPTLTGILIMLEVPFTYVLEFFLIGTELNILTYIGVGILVASSIFYKIQSKKKKRDANEYTEIPDPANFHKEWKKETAYAA